MKYRERTDSEYFDPIRGELRVSRPLSWVEWCEAHAFVTNGAHKGRWAPSTFPMLTEAMQLVDRSWVQEVTVCGPTRGGKTLTFVVNWIIRSIHEGRESLLMSSTSEKASETWKEIDGSMRASATLRDLLLPERYAGSLERRSFANGAVLRSVGANSLQSLGGFSAEIACCSEVDKYPRQLGDEAGATAQAKARTTGYPWTRKIVRESTPATADSLLWPDLQSSHLYRPWVACPRCGAEQILHYDTDDGIEPADPKRPLAMTGKGGLRWEGETREDVAASAHYLCPHCSGRWTESERSRACREARWLGPSRSDPADEAKRPISQRPSHIGLWWSALYLPWTDLGVEARACWAALQGRAADETVQSVTQHRAALPYTPPELEVSELTEFSVASRVTGNPKNEVPAGATLTGFVDIKADRLDWVVCAWEPGAVGTIIDYGIEAVSRPQASLGRDAAEATKLAAGNAILEGLVRLRRRLGQSAGATAPELLLIDSGWDVSQAAVAKVCRSEPRWMAAKGFGGDTFAWSAGGARAMGKVVQQGDNWKVYQQTDGSPLVLVNADYWKAAVHRGFAAEPSEPGSLRIYGTDPARHIEFAREITAEAHQRQWVEGKGFDYRWVKLRKDNHKLDCVAGARCAADILGVQVMPDEPEAVDVPSQPQPDPERRTNTFTGGSSWWR